MLLVTVAKFWNKMVETGTNNLANWHLFRIPHDQYQPLFMEKFLKYSDVRDEKRIFGIMYFQKKSRYGNEKRIFKRI